MYVSKFMLFQAGRRFSPDFLKKKKVFLVPVPVPVLIKAIYHILVIIKDIQLKF